VKSDKRDANCNTGTETERDREKERERQRQGQLIGVRQRLSEWEMEMVWILPPKFPIPRNSS